MSLYSIMSKVAREMDKQRFQNIKQQEKEKRGKDSYKSEAIPIKTIIPQNNNLLLVEENIREITTLFDAWADQFFELEEIRSAMNIENKYEDYIENLQNTLAITECALEEIEIVPEVFEVPYHTQQYLSKVKESFLWVLKCHIRRLEVILNGIINTIENGMAIENMADLANEFLLKAAKYVKSGNRYIEKALQSV